MPTRAQIREFFDALFPLPEGVVELRALPTSKARHFGRAIDLEGHLEFLARHRDEDLYFGVAARRDASSGALDNCTSLGALFVDVDFKSIPEAEARQRVEAFAPPSIVIESGGGLHCYWLLADPLDLHTQEQDARNLLRRIAHAVGGDLSAAEPARILRVPETANKKYVPARRVEIETLDPQRRYELAELAALLPPEPEPHGHAPGGPFRMPGDVGQGERRTTLFRLARSLRLRDLSLEEVTAACLTANRDRCRPPLSEAEAREEVHKAFTRRDRADFNGHPRSGEQETAAGVEVEDVEPEEQPCAEEALVLPAAAWRGPFADYRDAVAGTSEAPDAAHFAALWGIVATTLRRHVWVYYAYRHYPNVYLIVFGTTGDSKTSAARQALALVEGDESVRVLRSLGSAEALCDWMQGEAKEGAAAPVSHLLFLEELAGALTRGGWEGSSLLSFLTETFDTPGVYEIPFRKRPVKVVEPTPTLLAGTTPDWFWRSMREVDFHGGFGNRLFFMTGTPKAPIAMPGRPRPEPLARVRHALDQLVELPPTELMLTSDALALWEEFYVAWKTTAAAFDPLSSAATKRIPAYALKLAMTYAAFEGAGAIGLDQLQAALLVADYGARCVRQLIGARQQQTTQGRCEHACLAALQPGDLPAWRVHHAVGGRFSADEIVKGLRALCAAGVVEVVRLTGRKTAIFGLRRPRREA